MVTLTECRTDNGGGDESSTGCRSPTRIWENRKERNRRRQMASFPPWESPKKTTATVIPATHQGIIMKMYDKQRSINSFVGLRGKNKLWSDLCGRSDSSCYCTKAIATNGVKVRRVWRRVGGAALCGALREVRPSVSSSACWYSRAENELRMCRASFLSISGSKIALQPAQLYDTEPALSPPPDGPFLNQTRNILQRYVWRNVSEMKLFPFYETVQPLKKVSLNVRNFKSSERRSLWRCAEVNGGLSPATGQLSVSVTWTPPSPPDQSGWFRAQDCGRLSREQLRPRVELEQL